MKGKTLGTGSGPSKKAAQQAAAQAALASLLPDSSNDETQRRSRPSGSRRSPSRPRSISPAASPRSSGPNGSGKSNLVDAFRWVLGETSSKSLRSGKLEDVIFAGNDKRKPLGLAEVSLTFDNTDGKLPIDFSEVEITRRAYRAGESEYFINRSQVRLRDIVELLMGTGLGPGSYAIVSQGQIDSILTSKPTERRALFEETAGINKFLARKHESMRRLEQTETQRDSHQRPHRRTRAAHSRTRYASAPRQALPQGERARARPRNPLVHARQRIAPRRTRNAAQRTREARRAARCGGRARSRSSARTWPSCARARTSKNCSSKRCAGRRKANAPNSRGSKPTTPRRSRAAKRSNRSRRRPHEDAARVQAERESLGVDDRSISKSAWRRWRPSSRPARERELAGADARSRRRARNSTRSSRTCAKSKPHAAQRRSQRPSGACRARTCAAEAERLEGEAHAARERVAQLEIAAGAASQKYAEREAQLGALEAQLLRGARTRR